MKTNNDKHENTKRLYEKPEVYTIKLAAEEVLGFCSNYSIADGCFVAGFCDPGNQLVGLRCSN